MGLLHRNDCSIHSRCPEGKMRASMEPLEQRLLLAGDIIVTVTSLTTNLTSPELTGTVSDDQATVWVTVDGQSNQATVDQVNDTWSLDLGGLNLAQVLSEGMYDILAVASNSGTGKFGTDDTDDELVIQTTLLAVTIDALTTNDACIIAI